MMLHNGKLLLEISNAHNGNFKATAFGESGKRYKLEVKLGNNKQTFDIRSDGVYELFPLQYGDGKYTATLYECVTGNKYVTASVIEFQVKLDRPDASQLVPNQYVNYTESSPVVMIADVMCNSINEKIVKYSYICDYVATHYRYDYVKAVLKKSGTLPDIDGTYRKGMGICQDLSALTVAMLRSQGIPSKLVIGYAGKQYHAWVTAKVGNKELFFDPTAAVSNKKLSKHYTIERWY